ARMTVSAWLTPVIEADVHPESPDDPSTRMLPRPWRRKDEWYAFRTNPRRDVQVLAHMDDAQMGASTMGGDHPIAWKREIEVVDLGREAARYASAVVGEPARIVAAGSDNFPDGYPLLVCTLASLADLNRRLPSALPMNRFRPNIVLDGTTAWEEDQIKELRIGDAGLKLVKACTRCAVTGIDQQEGQKGLSPLPVLQEFRFDAQQRGVTFGQNARVARGAGSLLRVGDAVQISG
ncbi:MAG: hypothetical protein RL597_939, partial [Pseudomonadota bacterium]